MKYPRKTAAITFLIGMLLVAGYPLTDTPVQAQSSGLTVVAVGDSLIDGFCTSSGGDFVAQLSQWSGVPIINEGIIGDETEDVLSRLDRDVLSYDPDVVILLVGGNDILDNDPRAETVDNIRTIIETIQASGAEVLFLGAHGEVWESNYEADYAAVANDTGAYLVNNVLRSVLGRPSLMCDLVHPNDAGHMILAEETFPEFQNLVNTEYPEAPLTGSCTPEVTELMTGRSVQYVSYAVGGGGSYDYDWSGDEIGSGSGRTINVRYDSEGTKDASVTVTGTSDSATFDCEPEVSVMNEVLSAECRVSDTDIFLRDSVTYSVDIDGGSGNYDISWSGSEGTSGEDRSLRTSFESEGTKTVQVEVESIPDGETVTATCPAVRVSEPTLVGTCAVDMVFNEDREEVTYNWDVQAYGGDGVFDVDWDTNFTNDPTDDDEDGERISETFSFADDGMKSATANVTSGSQLIALTCGGEIPTSFTIEENRSFRLSCDVSGSPLAAGEELRWMSSASSVIGDDIEYDWSGTDGLSASTKVARQTYDSSGRKSGTVEITGDDFATSLMCQTVIGEAGEVDPSSGGGCFIATAAYGSKLIYEVETLRKFRDQYLLTNAPGQAFVSLYYEVGPLWADRVAENNFTRTVVRAALTPVVFVVSFFV